MDLYNERERLIFMVQRDGVELGIKFAKQTTKIYLAAIKVARRRYGRNCPYRRELLEGAASFRFLLRNMATLQWS